MIASLATLALLAAAAQHAEPPGADHSRLVAEIDANLRTQILGKWYPRAVDRTHGGFAEDFDAQWKPRGPELQRSIVYQARLTWTAARACSYDPKLAPEYRAYARHGLDYLRTAMWDAEKGGFYWQIDASTHRPTSARGDEKHAYGNAFGIYAAAAGYALTHDPRDLDLAKRAYAWLDRHAHDAVNGGYFEALARDGTPLFTAPGGAAADEIGTTYSQKSMNTHIHLLEAFTELYMVWPDATVRARLDELFHGVRDKVYNPDGYLTMFFKPDWTRASTQDSYGHDIETAYLLVEAAEALGLQDDEKTWEVARKLVDHALRYGWDAAHGGFYDHGEAGQPASGTDKVWWTQAEGLNALLLMEAHSDQTETKYRQGFLKQWQFIQQHQVDHTQGGWRSSVSRDGTPPAFEMKSDQWKDPYHQGRALMNVLRRLPVVVRFWKLYDQGFVGPSG